MIDWLEDPMVTKLSDEEQAFENFFHHWIFNVETLAAWGPELWRTWHLDVVDGHAVFDSPKYRTLFLLRWL